MNIPEKAFLRRDEAAAYLQARYGFGATRTLAKAATCGGGPAYRKAGRICLYEQAELDRWALAKLSPLMRSTSDRTETDRAA